MCFSCVFDRILIMDALTDKQRKFCIEYMKDFNATQAAIRSGYRKRTAGSMGTENLQKPLIKAELDRLREKVYTDAEITVNDIVQRLTDLSVNAKKDSDRLRALELLGRYKAMFTEKTQVKHTGQLVNRVINVNPSNV